MSDYSEYVGKRVMLTHNLKEANDKGELAEELEGTVEAANPLGVMFKPKGQVKALLFEAGDIEEVRYAPEKAKTMKAKTLKPITFGQAKGHLLERHGLTLAEVNGLTEEQALEYHNGLDHVALDLGHVHGEKESAPAAAAQADEDAA
jgi:hypothetical protein